MLSWYSIVMPPYVKHDAYLTIYIQEIFVILRVQGQLVLASPRHSATIDTYKHHERFYISVTREIQYKM